MTFVVFTSKTVNCTRRQLGISIMTTEAAQPAQDIVQNGKTQESFSEFFDTRAMPKPKQEKKPGQLPDETIRQFFEDVSVFFY